MALRSSRWWLAVACATVVVAGACGSPERPTLTKPPPGPTSSAAPAPEEHTPSLVAEAKVPRVAIYDGPDTPRPSRTLRNPQPSGAPLVFLVQDERDPWLEVLLPVRPNGSTGWIRMADVELSEHHFRIMIEVGAHRLTVYKGKDVFLKEPVGLGTRDTPTPGGIYYTKELLRPANPRGVYGPYAYGLSGFSNVLKSFAGGEGVIGIHGTNNPAGIGKDVSKGCIRLRNAAITKLAKELPLGVPVEILP